MLSLDAGGLTIEDCGFLIFDCRSVSRPPAPSSNRKSTILNQQSSILPVNRWNGVVSSGPGGNINRAPRLQGRQAVEDRLQTAAGAVGVTPGFDILGRMS
jgi:hypothetical protein